METDEIIAVCIILLPNITFELELFSHLVDQVHSWAAFAAEDDRRFESHG